MTRFSEDVLAVPDFQAVQVSIFSFHRFVTTNKKVAVFVTQISHYHWSNEAGTAVDDCHNVSLHLCTIWEHMLLGCQLLFPRSMGHIERRIASRMSLGNSHQCVSLCRCSKISQAWMVRESSSIWAAFGGDKICLLSSRLLQAANGSWRAVIQLLGQFLDLLLPSSRSRNVAILGPSHSSHRIHAERVSQRSVASGFPAAFIACFSATCTTPMKSLARYDQVLQLGPFFFPNQSGIEVFGSANRTRDLVSTILRRAVNS